MVGLADQRHFWFQCALFLLVQQKGRFLNGVVVGIGGVGIFGRFRSLRFSFCFGQFDGGKIVLLLGFRGWWFV